MLFFYTKCMHIGRQAKEGDGFIRVAEIRGVHIKEEVPAYCPQCR